MAKLVNTVVEVGTLGLVSDVTGVEEAQDAANRAGEIQAEAASEGVAESRRQFDVTQASLQPFQEAGVGALAQQQAMLGLSGQEAQQQAFAGLAESPGQKFLRDRQERALVRNAAATGGSQGGNVQTALQQQAVGFAQQDIQNQFGRLGQLAGQGQSAATNIGQFGAQSVAQQNAARQSAAEARASGILGAGQANAQFTGQVLGTAAQLGGAYLGASDKRLKSNIVKVGEANGHNWYTWTWNYLANKIGLFGESNGVIADELQETRPDLVGMQNGYLAVNYAGLGV